MWGSCLEVFLRVWFDVFGFVFTSSYQSFTLRPCDTFQLKLFGQSREAIKILLVDICLSKVDEVQHGHQVLGFQPPHVDQGVGVIVFL